MQVNNIYISPPLPPKTGSVEDGSRSRRFDQELESSLNKAGNKTSAGKNKISLGTISDNDPTVSHLLIKHQDYGESCWDIIHSGPNQDKPYTRIPAGTQIYLDTVTEEITWERESPSASQRDLIEQIIDRAASEHDLPRELIAGVIRAESGYNPESVSRAGARGLMQLMPETARELGVNNPFDIRENIDGGTRYLKKMLNLFSGDLGKALAAYNAGPGAVQKFGGEVPYAETREYVARVLSFLE